MSACAPVGGGLAASVATMQGTKIDDYSSLDLTQLVSDIQGRHVLIVAHGFNVNRADGIEHLSNWEALLQLPPLSALSVCCGPATPSGPMVSIIPKSPASPTTRAAN